MSERDRAVTRLHLAARLYREYAESYIEAMGGSHSEPLDDAEMALIEALMALDRLDYPQLPTLALPLSWEDARRLAETPPIPVVAEAAPERERVEGPFTVGRKYLVEGEFLNDLMDQIATLKAENATLRQALEVYANEDNWHVSGDGETYDWWWAGKHGWREARLALGQED